MHKFKCLTSPETKDLINAVSPTCNVASQSAICNFDAVFLILDLFVGLKYNITTQIIFISVHSLDIKGYVLVLLDSAI